MQLLNVCGCREYLESLGSRQRLLHSYIVKTRVPFIYQLIQYWGSEPKTMRFIFTTSKDLCMMRSLIYIISHHLSKLQTPLSKYFQRGISPILIIYLGYIIMLWIYIEYHISYNFFHVHVWERIFPLVVLPFFPCFVWTRSM